MKTKNGVELNLQESDYKFEFCHAVFYFSSEFNLQRYKNSVIQFVEMEQAKIINRYKVKAELRLYLAISLYKKIEKRGFRVLYRGQEVEEDCIFEL